MLITLIITVISEKSPPTLQIKNNVYAYTSTYMHNYVQHKILRL